MMKTMFGRIGSAFPTVVAVIAAVAAAAIVHVRTLVIAMRSSFRPRTRVADIRAED